ncbi:hypothetical protein [Sciscionella marina]|uniref:hypothetical protein n=1 Tax=Sciscionella marina TaxID=508770 RepID=UPI00036ED086|nr:hypothetical protein [Sciscionella marina]
MAKKIRADQIRPGMRVDVDGQWSTVKTTDTSGGLVTLLVAAPNGRNVYLHARRRDRMETR